MDGCTLEIQSKHFILWVTKLPADKSFHCYILFYTQFVLLHWPMFKCIYCAAPVEAFDNKTIEQWSCSTFKQRCKYCYSWSHRKCSRWKNVWKLWAELAVIFCFEHAYLLLEIKPTVFKCTSHNDPTAAIWTLSNVCKMLNHVFCMIPISTNLLVLHFVLVIKTCFSFNVKRFEVFDQGALTRRRWWLLSPSGVQYAFMKCQK